MKRHLTTKGWGKLYNMSQLKVTNLKGMCNQEARLQDCGGNV